MLDHLVCCIDVGTCIDQRADGPHTICLSGSSECCETALCTHTGWRDRGRAGAGKRGLGSQGG